MPATDRRLRPLLGRHHLRSRPGFVIVLIITWVLSIGINQTKRTNDVMVLIKLAIIVLFIVCAVWYVKPSNWQPFSPYGIYTFQPGSTQPYGIVPAASIVFFSLPSSG